MQRFACPRRYPSMLTEDDVIQALTSMHAVLRDGGILVLTQAMCDKQLRDRPHYTPIINTPDFSRIFVTEYCPETLRIDILDLLHSNSANDFQVCSIEYRILLQDDYARLLAEVDYQDIEFFSNFNFEQYDKAQSDRLIVVAVK